MPNRMVAYFVRHGTTDLNKENVFRGQDNPPLDTQGLKDADTVAKYLRPIEFGTAYMSPLDRTETTAERILEPRGQTASPTDDLLPWDTGYLTGQPKTGHEKDIKYYQNHPNTKVPQGESINDLKARATPRIRIALNHGLSMGVPSLVVTHSSIIRVLSDMLHGDHNQVKVKPGGVVGVFHDGKSFKAVPLFRKEDAGEKTHYGA